LGPDEVTVFACVGLPFQDLVAAWSVYKNALLRRSARSIDFLR